MTSEESNGPTVLEKWLDDNDKTQRWLAEQFDVQPPSVNAWLKKVPAERVPRVSEITGLSMHELRPDVYPKPRAA